MSRIVHIRSAQSHRISTVPARASSTLRIFGALILLLCSALPLDAQLTPTGLQEYFVLGYNQHVWDFMQSVQATEPGAPNPFASGLNSVITAVASADNQLVIYDHWEDGLEADVFNPVQASTLVIGDADPSNGDACDFNNQACGVDVLQQGDFLNFSSDAGLLAGCTVPSAQPATFTELCSTVPVNPRCAIQGACTNAEVRFDGGDFLQTTGGPLSLVHSQDPLTQFIGGSTEVISRQAVEAARSYSVPIGVDLYDNFGCVTDPPPGGGCVMEPFQYVELNLVAFEDNTQIFVDSPDRGAGFPAQQISFTLDRGEHWSSFGFIDNSPFDPNLQIAIHSGARVSTSAPIAGMIFTGGDGTWATRHYTMLPDILHSTDYMTTAPGDNIAIGPDEPDRPTNLYIFNPDRVNPITVAVTDTSGTNNIVVPPNGVVDYITGTGNPRVPSDSTVRLTSNRNFWGISASDIFTNISDWGHAWLATKFLTPNYTVGFAPGNVNNPPDVNLSAVYIAATQNNTLVQIDLDNDGNFDEVDLDGDNVIDPADIGSGDPTQNIYVVDILEGLSVFDPPDAGVPPDPDFDNTGTRIVANKPVAVSWGQETDLTGFGDTARDTGYTVYPVHQLFLDPALIIDKTAMPRSVDLAGGIVTYLLTIQTFDFGPITNLEAYDLLPVGIVGADYVTGSTLITYPNLVQDTADPIASIDPDNGRDRLDWSLSPDTLGTNQTLTIRYQVAIPAAPGNLPRQLTNEAHADGTLGGSIFSPFDTETIAQTNIDLMKSVDLPLIGPNGDLTYTLDVTNTSTTLVETNVTITDPIPPDTTFLGPIGNDGVFTGAFDPAQNAVVWTNTGGDFLPGASVSLSFVVRVHPGAMSGTLIQNEFTYESDQNPFVASNVVESEVVAPDLVAFKTGPALLHPNEEATFEIVVENQGAASTNNLLTIDTLPTNTTYVAESMQFRLNAAPFQSVTDAADGDEGTLLTGPPDELRLNIPNLGPGEDVTFRFRVRVNGGTAGQFVNNQALISSDEVPPFDTNLVQVPIVGAAEVTGHVFLDLDGNGAQDPGEPDLANVDVVIIDSTGNLQTVSTDANGDWVADVELACYEDGFALPAYNGSDGTFDWSPTPWTEINDPPGTATTGDVRVLPDPLLTFGNTLRINQRGAPAPPAWGAERPVDLSAFNNSTLLYNFRRLSMAAGETVVVDVSYDGGVSFPDSNVYNGGDDAAWQSDSITLDAVQLPSSNVVIRVRATAGMSGGTDEFFLDNVRVCRTDGVTANVDESDPDFPAGANLTTANDPQSVVVVPNGSVATGDVGYQPLPISFRKDSNAVGGEVFPGQIVTYTLTATNNTGVAQTGIDINDPLPVGTLAVPGSTQVSIFNSVVRVTEYFLAAGSFAGTTFDLTLSQPLQANYFAILQGSDGDTSATGTRGPDENYARLTQDPFGTGELGVSTGPSVLRLERGNAVNSWVGVVTVVECLSDCDGDGFTLTDVRVLDHVGVATAGAEAAAAPFGDINQVMLVGGYNGAGCSTAETSSASTKVCHTRLFPSGPDQVNWTRDGGGATLSSATSTVMVVEWGGGWNVQRVRVQGLNGGDGANAVGEYNTAAINPVNRDETWVWGTGHTTDNGIGDAAEGVLVTLGDGVNQNAVENTVAVGSEYNDTVDFEVWALTHANLAVDYRFKADGDSGAVTVDLAVDAATMDRMALVSNGQNGEGTAYPRPMFSARYLDDTTVRLERRRSGQDFPAWVQGIDFSGLNGLLMVPGNDPPGLVVPADGFVVQPGQTMTVTFQVQVDPDLAPAITQITNTATLNTDQQGPFNASVTDDVIRLGAVVEPNNAGFAEPGGTVTYTHFVVNTGEIDDSYDITPGTELGFPLELIDPNTGSVIAVDADGNGVWDSMVTINTGTLAPGEQVEYRLRVTVPGGTPVGTEETSTLFATSDNNAALVVFATDETTVVAPGGLNPGPVQLVPDHSGVVAPGGRIVYTHSLTNNTGATDTFDLTASPTEPGWTATFYDDSNGNGVWDDGIDVAINNSRQLADGQLQTLFVVIDAPAGATPGDTDVTHLTATSRNDPQLFDGATDTTTVNAASTHDLSGGGTLLVDPGENPAFPGTIRSLSDNDDRFEFTITPSPFFNRDGLNHPTELWIDTNGDGTPDTRIAEDSDGDGDWDFIAPGFDTNGDLNPDVEVLAGAELAYSLRRPVDPNQGAYRDPVTLSVTSRATGEKDSITATNLLAAATHVLFTRFETYLAGGQAVVEWETGLEIGTLGFYVERQQGNGPYRRLHGAPVPAQIGVPQGGIYRFIDTTADPEATYRYQLVELETSGRERFFGPFPFELGAERPVPSGRLLTEGMESEPRRSQVRARPTTNARAAAQAAAAPRSGAGADTRLRLQVREGGLHFLASGDIAALFGVPVATVEDWVRRRGLVLTPTPVASGEIPDPPCGRHSFDPGHVFSDGFESGDDCAWKPAAEDPGPAGQIAWLPADDASGLYAYLEGIDSIYSRDNAYFLTTGAGRWMTGADGGSPPPVLGQQFVDHRHFEEETVSLTAAIDDPDSDFWFWNFLIAGHASLGSRTYTLAVPGAVVAEEAQLHLELQAQSGAESVAIDHRVVVSLNGSQLGQLEWDGATSHQASFKVGGGLLVDGDNTLELLAEKIPGVAFDILYLQDVDLVYNRRYVADGDRLEAPGSESGTVTVEGFGTAGVSVFDITDASSPQVLVNVAIGSDGGSFSASFDSAGAGSRYLAQPLGLATTPVYEFDLPSDLRSSSNRGEYVVLAGAGLEPAAAELAAYRGESGLEAMVVRLQDIYDEFNGGVPRPLAIRDFLEHALKTWARPPRILALAGDASFDFKDIQGRGENLVPSPLVATDEGLFPADHRLADLNSDGVPEIAIGRIAALSNDELSGYVDKLKAFEATGGGWRSEIAFVADGVDEGGEFVDDTETLIPLVSGILQPSRIYVDDLEADPARQALLDTFASGALVVNYLGHGGTDRLADEGLLKTTDVAGMANGGQAPVLLALTCAVGRFDFPGFDTLSETVVTHGNGGAIAVWAPSGLSFNAEALALGSAFLEQAFSGGSPQRLGSLVQTALGRYLSEGGEDAQLPFLFILHGDPAILVQP